MVAGKCIAWQRNMVSIVRWIVYYFLEIVKVEKILKGSLDSIPSSSLQ